MLFYDGICHYVWFSSFHQLSYGGFYVVCDHGKHRNAKRYNSGCDFAYGGKTKVTHQIFPFSNNNKKLAVKFLETPICLFRVQAASSAAASRTKAPQVYGFGSIGIWFSSAESRQNIQATPQEVRLEGSWLVRC